VSTPRLFEPIGRRSYLVIAVLSMVLLFGVWTAVTYGGLVSDLVLPTPGAVLHSLQTGINDGTLLTDTRDSVVRILVGFVISSLLAIPVGVLMGSYKIIEAALEPPIDFIRYMPAVAFIPLTLIWFGTSATQKIDILFSGIFFQEVLLIMDNVKNVPRQLVDMAYTLGLNQWHVLRTVVFRASLPGIVDTLRISMGWAWTYLVVAEHVGAESGLGFRIQQAQRYLDTGEIVLGIMLIGLLGLIFDFSFKFIYARSFKYLGSRAGSR
jgi:NitT/TauT family transport system permease protein